MESEAREAEFRRPVERVLMDLLRHKRLWRSRHRHTHDMLPTHSNNCKRTAQQTNAHTSVVFAFHTGERKERRTWQQNPTATTTIS